MSREDVRMIKFVDLEVINKLAEKHGYNRRVDVEGLREHLEKEIKHLGFDSLDEVVWPISPLLVHEHKAGKKCEAHMRVCMHLMTLGEDVIIDCDMHLWESFPKIEDPTENLRGLH
tara:strand:- start:1465 stop:1812 length:348 start_codon:yes stop_codon:yes gene_type:complete